MDENPYQSPESTQLPVEVERRRGFLSRDGALFTVLGIVVLVLICVPLLVEVPVLIAFNASSRRAIMSVLPAMLFFDAIAAGLFWYGSRLRNRQRQREERGSS